MLGAAALVVAGRWPDHGALLRCRWLVSVGRVSYGWYLRHWPLLALLSVYNLGPVSTWLRVVAVSVALGVAVPSYRFLEVRFRAPPSGSRREVAAPRRTAMWGRWPRAWC